MVLAWLAALSKEIGITVVGTMALYDLVIPREISKDEEHSDQIAQIAAAPGFRPGSGAVISSHQEIGQSEGIGLAKKQQQERVRRHLLQRRFIRLLVLVIAGVAYVKLRSWVAVDQLVRIYRKVRIGRRPGVCDDAGCFLPVRGLQNIMLGKGSLVLLVGVCMLVSTCFLKSHALIHSVCTCTHTRTHCRSHLHPVPAHRHDAHILTCTRDALHVQAHQAAALTAPNLHHPHKHTQPSAKLVPFAHAPPPHTLQVENPIPFATTPATRARSTAYLHARYMGLLLAPLRLSADWSYACIPLVESWADPRNLPSLFLYAWLAFCGLSAGPVGLVLDVMRGAARAVGWRGVGASCGVQEGAQRGSKQQAAGQRVAQQAGHTAAAAAAAAPGGSGGSVTSCMGSGRGWDRDRGLQPRVAAARWRLFVVAGLLVGPFFPASNVLFYVGTFIGERLLYMPSVGFCLLLAQLLGELTRPREASRGIVSRGAAAGGGDGRTAAAAGSDAQKPSVAAAVAAGGGDAGKAESATAATAAAAARPDAAGESGERGGVGGVVGCTTGQPANRTGPSLAASARPGEGPPCGVLGTARVPDYATGAGAQQRVRGLLLLALLVAPLLSFYGVRTWLRNEDWRDEEQLFVSALRVCPDSAKVRLNSGILMRRHRRFDDALAHFRWVGGVVNGWVDVLG